MSDMCINKFIPGSAGAARQCLLNPTRLDTTLIDWAVKRTVKKKKKKKK